MQKVVRKLKKTDEDPNILYWASLSPQERISNLEKIRKEVIKATYGTDPGFQRVARLIKRKSS